MDKSKHETDVRDPTLGVTQALKTIDVKAMSYVQLRRLYAALVHVSGEVDTEIKRRSDADSFGKTARMEIPKKSAPN